MQQGKLSLVAWGLNRSSAKDLRNFVQHMRAWELERENTCDPAFDFQVEVRLYLSTAER